MLSLAAEALRQSVGEGFRLEIGHVGFFQSLMRQLPADGETKDAIRTLIENKNYAGLSDELDALPPSQTVDVLRRLPRLFGGEEVLRAAASLCHDEDTKEALACLARLYLALRRLGLGDQVMIDLGLVQENEYYTGVIFRGYIEGSGDTVVSGGRYDTLRSSSVPSARHRVRRQRGLPDQGDAGQGRGGSAHAAGNPGARPPGP